MLSRSIAAVCFLAGCGEPARPLSPSPSASVAAPVHTGALAPTSASAPEPVTSVTAAASATAPPLGSASPVEPTPAQGDAALALGAVEKLPEIKSFCETLELKHGLSCILYVSEVPEEKCGPGPVQPLDACNFGVYVGEKHKTHASRFATFFVRPGAWTVVGADDFACGGMSIADYKKLRAARLKAKPDEAVDCPGD